jgi:hypothetical protein
MIKKLFVLVALATAFSLAPAKQDKDTEILEFELTARAIELDVEFEACGQKTTVRVQDGAMNTLSIDGSEPVRFIVKQGVDGDIKLFPVKRTKFKHGSKLVDGLIAESGISILQSTGAADLKKAGVKSLHFKTMYDIQEVGASDSTEQRTALNSWTQREVKCCTFSACNDKVGRYCNAGPGCGGDSCGSCCVDGGRGGGGGFPHIP